MGAFVMSGRDRVGDGLDDFEAFELRMAEIKRLVAAGTPVRVAESFRPGPFKEILFRLPDRMRAVETVVVALRAAQHVEFDETGDHVEVAFPVEPDRFEIGLRSR